MSKVDIREILGNGQPCEGLEPAWYDEITVDFQREDSENGTDSADSLGTVNVNFRVPEKHVATITIGNFTVDDQGHLSIYRKGETEKLLHLGMDAGIDGEPGERGGHEAWTKTGSVQLIPGDYVIEINQENADYIKGDPRFNVSKCKLSLTATKEEAVLRSLAVNFTRSSVILNKEKTQDIENCYCTSGYVYTGVLKGSFYTGTAQSGFVERYSREYGETHTGGWMSNDSPWCRTEVKTSAEQGDADPTRIDMSKRFDPDLDKETLWPDTSCPAGTFDGHTYPYGKRKGYIIDTPKIAGSHHPDELRSGSLIHLGEFGGSEGCLSLQDESLWEKLVKAMEVANKHPETYKISISYGGNTPNPFRHPESAETKAE